jgi:hypothetical protein
MQARCVLGVGWAPWKGPLEGLWCHWHVLMALVWAGQLLVALLARLVLLSAACLCWGAAGSLGRRLARISGRTACLPASYDTRGCWRGLSRTMMQLTTSFCRSKDAVFAATCYLMHGGAFW